MFPDSHMTIAPRDHVKLYFEAITQLELERLTIKLESIVKKSIVQRRSFLYKDPRYPSQYLAYDMKICPSCFKYNKVILDLDTCPYCGAPFPDDYAYEPDVGGEG